MRTRLAWFPIALAVTLLGCGRSDSGGPAPDPTASPKESASPVASPADAGPAPAAPAPAPAAPPTASASASASDAFEVVEKDCGDVIGCYEVRRGGVVVPVPPEVTKALTDTSIAPVLTPDRKGILYVQSTGKVTELMRWHERAASHRLVRFDPGVEGVSPLVWSPAGKQLAFVVKGKGYPKQTRLFLLEIASDGTVERKHKLDVEVFTECGGACVPTAPTWRSQYALQVPSVGEGEPGPAATISTAHGLERLTSDPCCCQWEAAGGGWEFADSIPEDQCATRPDGSCAPGRGANCEFDEDRFDDEDE